MLSTREHIIRLADEGYPNMATIAREIGISRERVRQLMRKSGREEYRKCRKIMQCAHCGWDFPRMNARDKYCSTGCSAEGRKRPVICNCHWCGEVLIRQPAQVARRKFMFCNKRCYGKWLGTNFGRGRRKVLTFSG